jgi:choline dehydrogenase-like flavoprotein
LPGEKEMSGGGGRERRASGARAPARTASLHADVCVIGAGPAGITVSKGLIDAGARVILAETGGLDYDPSLDELSRGVAEGPIIKGYGNYLLDGRRRRVGGAASGWGPGFCMPFRSIDLGDRPWVADSVWPLRPGELAPYERMAAATFGFEPFEAPLADGPLVRLSYRYPPDPQIFPALFSELVLEPRFHAELGATAVELELHGERVTKMRLVRDGGEEILVCADVVVLACGGIENARFLLRHEHQLPSQSGMIGRYFMEHPHVLAGAVWLPDAAELRSLLVASRSCDVLALDDASQAGERLLNATVQLRPQRRDVPDAGPVICELYVRAEQAPNPESRVLLGNDVDRFGCPRPVLEWRLLDEDWASIVRTASLVASGLEWWHGANARLAINAGTPWPWKPADPGSSPLATWGNHHLGTTRMAERADEGVVDKNSLVHGMENLYVAGSSVFPTGGCANPTFMIVTLAHRLVDHLVGSLGRAKPAETPLAEP